MKALFLTTILFSCICLSSLAQPVAMVKNMAFPYATGLAFDSTTYANVRAKFQAADAVIKKSKVAIDSLQGEIRQTRKALDEYVQTSDYQVEQYEAMAAQKDSLEKQLAARQATLAQAQAAIASIVDALPRRVRKSFTTPDQIASATVDYIHLLQARKWKWLGVGSGVTFILTLIAALK